MGDTRWFKTKHPRIRHYSPPKFGWKPPSLSSDTESKPVPRAFARKAFIAYSDAALDRIHTRFGNGSGILSILVQRLTSPPEPSYERPPDLPDDQYTVDIA
jgi:hypothetical protein